MNLFSIDTGFFKLDGGAMFGVVPRVIWKKLIPPDSNNHIPMAMRCLLIETPQRRILIDCGMGNKQDPRWQGFYYRHGEGDLLRSLSAVGASPEDITDVILSHLHFDHCGGAVSRHSDGQLLPTFPKATYWTHSQHWASAMAANPREKATFLPENLLPLEASGQLQFIDTHPTAFEGILTWQTADGHTEKMLLPSVIHKNKKLVFTADLIPTAAHIPVNYLMGYDVRPLVTMDEKAAFLTEAAREGWVLFSDHDPTREVFTVQTTERGFGLLAAGTLAEFMR